MKFVVKRIPDGHPMKRRWNYVIIDEDRVGLVHPDLGYTMSGVVDEASIPGAIEALEMKYARQIMTEGTAAEGL